MIWSPEDLFSQKVSEISGGTMRIEVTESEDALAALDAGADLMMAPNEVVARANGDYSRRRLSGHSRWGRFTTATAPW
jgi:hypothetical protein